MAVLCTNLDTLEPVEVRVATQIGIDTGRRPEDILALPCNCLDRDKKVCLREPAAPAPILGAGKPARPTNHIVRQSLTRLSRFDCPAWVFATAPLTRCTGVDVMLTHCYRLCYTSEFKLHVSRHDSACSLD